MWWKFLTMAGAALVALGSLIQAIQARDAKQKLRQAITAQISAHAPTSVRSVKEDRADVVSLIGWALVAMGGILVAIGAGVDGWKS